MDQPPPSAADHPRNHDRLNGWKEIASHFGKSVRTVQRWEKDLRLPVHRIHTTNGEIVFALTSELHEWEMAQSSPPTDLAEAVEQTVAAQTSPPADATLKPRQPRSFWRLASVVAATAVLAVVAWEGLKAVGWHQVIALEHSEPAKFKVENMKLRVWDKSNVFLWEKDLDPFAPDFYEKNATAESPGQFNRIQIADLDGDHREEVLFAAYANDRSKYRLICYEHNGKLRFEYRPPKPPEYGDVEIHPPPMVSPGFMLTDDGNGQKHIWVVFFHNLNFPSVLVKLSPTGKELARYWSNGHINVMGVSEFRGKRVVLLGAMHTETRGVSLAMLDYDNPSGAAPSRTPHYRCANCSRGEPLKFVVFPRTDLGKLNDEPASASELRIAPGGKAILGLHLFTDKVPGEDAPAKGGSIYYLSPELDVIQAEHETVYRKMHATHRQNRTLHHAYGDQDLKELGIVRHWDGRDFVPGPYISTALPPKSAGTGN